MRYLGWILKLGLFALVFSFAVKNADPVAVRYYLGIEWQTPLVFALLVAFCAGVACGIVACLGLVFRQRREIAALKGGTPGARGHDDGQRRLENELQA